MSAETEPSEAAGRKPFWTTLPGVLTGFAAVISAITGLVAALGSADIFGNRSQDAAAAQYASTAADPSVSHFAKTAQSSESFRGILDKWAETRQGAGPLRSPTSAEMPTFDNVGKFRNFEGGIISWHPETGAHIVWGLIGERWLQIGRERFGYPISDEVATADGRGRYNHFRAVHLPGKPEASIYWSPGTGAHEVFGAIRTKWLEMGAEGSSLGYPIEAEHDHQGGRLQRFEGGALFWTPETGVLVQ